MLPTICETPSAGQKDAHKNGLALKNKKALVLM